MPHKDSLLVLVRGLLPIELAGLIAQVHGHTAPSPKVMACDGHHGASRLWPSDGAERHHGRVLWEKAEK